MKNSNLKNLLSKSGLKPIQGEVLTFIKGGKQAPSAPCKIKCGTNSADVGQ
jgi:hypothetical protein